MKKTELIFIVLAVLGLCGSLFLYPTAVILIMSAAWLAFLYFAFGFALFTNRPIKAIFSNNGGSSIRIAGAIGAGLALSLTVMGILYTAMRWPGAFIMLFTGVLGCLLVGIIVFLRNQSKKDAYSTAILKRVIPYFIIGFAVLLFSDNIFLDFKYRNYPDYVAAIKAAREDPMNQELKKKVEEGRQKMFFHRSKEE